MEQAPALSPVPSGRSPLSYPAARIPGLSLLAGRGGYDIRNLHLGHLGFANMEVQKAETKCSQARTCGRLIRHSRRLGHVTCPLTRFGHDLGLLPGNCPIRRHWAFSCYIGRGWCSSGRFHSVDCCFGLFQEIMRSTSRTITRYFVVFLSDPMPKRENMDCTFGDVEGTKTNPQSSVFPSCSFLPLKPKVQRERDLVEH